jgi:release factor glutamine methyltransferase
MTTAQAFIGFKKKLQSIYDEREADNISDWVFENVTGLKKWERRNNQNELTEFYSNKLEKYLDELLQHKPVQYVLNEAWFYKMKFFVNEHVLIPRPETEELVEWIVDDFRIKIGDLGFKEKLNFRIIDIGTGSGCIPVSLKKELPNANVTAIDISEKALLVARKNANELNAGIDFLQIDFLKENEWNTLQQYDIVVSNPPYIPIREKEILAKNVIEFEPGIALFVENNDPYIFYDKIAEFAQSHLNKNGKIYVEVHEEYAKNVKDIFENAGFISTIKKDIYGKERMVNAAKMFI